jgi:hypothetical protein
MPCVIMAALKYYYSTFFTVSILLYVNTYLRSYLWSDPSAFLVIYQQNLREKKTSLA